MPFDRRRWLWTLPLLIGAAAYLPSIRGQFVWDDHIHFERWIARGNTLREVLFPVAMRHEGFAHYYKPFAGVVGLVLFRVMGTWAPGWRLASLAFHLVTVFFLERLLRRWHGARPGTDMASILGASAFACWPATAEALGWISARSELLMGALLLPALLLHLRARDRGTTSLPAAGLFLLALLSKETAIGFLPVALAASLLLPRALDSPEESQSLLRPTFKASLWLPYALAYVAYSGIRRYAMEGESSIAGVAGNLLAADTPGLLVRALGFYLREALLLGSGPPFVQEVPDLPVDWVFGCLGVTVALGASVTALRQLLRGRPAPVSMAILWFFAFLSPALVVVGASLSVNALAIRYLYVPLIAVGPLVSRLALPLCERRPRELALASLPLVAGLVALVQVRVAPWLSDEALWTRGLRDNPRSLTALGNAATFTSRKGNLTGAEDYYRIGAYAGAPLSDLEVFGTLSRLAQTYLQEGKLEEARLTLIASTHHEGEHGGASRNLFISSVIDLMRSLETEAASSGPKPERLSIPRDRLRRVVDDLERAVEIDPLDRTTELLLARVLEAIDEPVRARAAFREIEASSIADPAMRDFAHKALDRLDRRISQESDPVRRVYFQAQEAEMEGNADKAIELYRNGLSAHPDRLELMVPLSELLAAQAHYAEAAELLEHATGTAPRDAALWFNLGLYRGAMEDRPGAVAALRKASSLAPDWPKAHLWLAKALVRVNDLDGAIEEYRRFGSTSLGDAEAAALSESSVAQLEARKMSPRPENGTPP